MDMTPASVELHVDTLVLEGMSDQDALRVRHAMQRELTRLCTEQGMPAGWARSADCPRIDAISLDAQSSANPVQIGKHIAKAIHGDSR